jgi:hypothetical protein
MPMTRTEGRRARNAAALVALVKKFAQESSEPAGAPRYTLDVLLARWDARVLRSAKDQEWLDASPVGRELL